MVGPAGHDRVVARPVGTVASHTVFEFPSHVGLGRRVQQQGRHVGERIVGAPACLTEASDLATVLHPALVLDHADGRVGILQPFRQQGVAGKTRAMTASVLPSNRTNLLGRQLSGDGLLRRAVLLGDPTQTRDVVLPRRIGSTLTGRQRVAE